MDVFFQAIPLSISHIQVIVRGLYEVAQCDQVHATEQTLLEEFYQACRRDSGGLADYKDIIRTEFDVGRMQEILNTVPLRHTFIRSCLLLSFADGSYSVPERKKLAEFAQALDIDAATLETLKDQVTEHLLAQLAGVQNVEALCALAKEMR